MTLGTFSAKRELKTEKPFIITVAVGWVRNDINGSRDGEGWTDWRQKLKVASTALADGFDVKK